MRREFPKATGAHGRSHMRKGKGNMMSDWRYICCDQNHEIPIDSLEWRCPQDHSPFRIEGPNQLDLSNIDHTQTTVARYAAVLPISGNALITLGAGLTPLLPGTLADHDVWFKLDSLLPTGSFKDRGAALVVSHYRSLGVQKIIVDSSGNAAAAMSAYAAAAGMECEVYCPASASPGKLVQARAYGATVIPVEGSRDAVAEAAQQVAEDDPSAVYASHNWSPLFAEGVKTWALEVWEQLGHRSPGAAFVPTGGGSALLGAARGFQAVDSTPTLIVAQPIACAPVVAALDSHRVDVEPMQASETIAEGAKISAPPRGRQLLEIVRESSGWGSAISEDALKQTLGELWSQGIYAEPTAALGAAAFIDAVNRDRLPDGPHVVLITGSGLKATGLIGHLLSETS